VEDVGLAAHTTNTVSALLETQGNTEGPTIGAFNRPRNVRSRLGSRITSDGTHLPTELVNVTNDQTFDFIIVGADSSGSVGIPALPAHPWSTPVGGEQRVSSSLVASSLPGGAVRATILKSLSPVERTSQSTRISPAVGCSTVFWSSVC
jgi:hypothetical protein